MILWGVVYSFLVTLFSSLLVCCFQRFFFLLTLRQLTRNLTFIFTIAYFYSYPFLITAIHHFYNIRWSMDHDCSGYFALISGHLLFRRNLSLPLVKQLLGDWITTPYAIVWLHWFLQRKDADYNGCRNKWFFAEPKSWFHAWHWNWFANILDACLVEKDADMNT